MTIAWCCACDLGMYSGKGTCSLFCVKIVILSDFESDEGIKLSYQVYALVSL
jgi:hypothetical protein